MNIIDILNDHGAPLDMIEWAASQRDQSPQALWMACRRGDRLAWFLGRLGARGGQGSEAHRRAVLVACLGARTTSLLWHDPACERAVDLAERWAWGDEAITREQIGDAADIAYAVADAADYAARVYSDIPRAVADAAQAAANAAFYAAFGADARSAFDTFTYAAYALAADGDDAAREEVLSALADMIHAAVPEVFL